MDVEPQRLIALSLGKIALSRGQRGGQRLHKSLLVAGVLLNARTACVSPCPMQSDDEEDLILTSPDAILIETESDYKSDIFDEQPQLSLLSLDTAAAPVQCETSRSIVDCLQQSVDHLQTSPCINNRPQMQTDLQNLSDISSDPRYCLNPCSRVSTVELTVGDPTSWDSQPEKLLCLSDDSSSTSRSVSKRGRESTEYPQTGSRKRLRYNTDEFASYPMPQKVSSFSQCSSASHENMQTENIQINTLVHSFSAGFSGLLRSVEPAEYTSCRYYGDEDGDIHESSSESIISCSTQIREALETLSRPMEALTRPIIAMSV